MTASELLVILNTALPSKVAYRAFPLNDAPAPPYICYYALDDDVLYADGENYHCFVNYNIELYSVAKDPESESKTELALSNAGIAWAKSETYIESEQLYQILYEIEV